MTRPRETRTAAFRPEPSSRTSRRRGSVRCAARASATSPPTRTSPAKLGRRAPRYAAREATATAPAAASPLRPASAAGSRLGDPAERRDLRLAEAQRSSRRLECIIASGRSGQGVSTTPATLSLRPAGSLEGQQRVVDRAETRPGDDHERQAERDGQVAHVTVGPSGTSSPPTPSTTIVSAGPVAVCDAVAPAARSTEVASPPARPPGAVTPPGRSRRGSSPAGWRRRPAASSS